jgi:hypothetical protein
LNGLDSLVLFLHRGRRLHEYTVRRIHSIRCFDYMSSATQVRELIQSVNSCHEICKTPSLPIFTFSVSRLISGAIEIDPPKSIFGYRCMTFRRGGYNVWDFAFSRSCQWQQRTFLLAITNCASQAKQTLTVRNWLISAVTTLSH